MHTRLDPQGVPSGRSLSWQIPLPLQDRLEIIHLRSSGEPIESLANRIRESIWSEGDQTEVVTIFRRNGLETDLTVHIRHPEAPGADVPSRLGLQLVSSLAVFGLVEHSVWEELK